MATTEPESPPKAPPTRIAKPKRGSETAFDMVRSLGLIAVIIAVTLIFDPGLIHPSKKDKFQAVDYSNYVEGFRSLTRLDPVLPSPAPTGWSSNSAALAGPEQAEHLRIGFVTLDQKYVGLVESIGKPGTVISTLLGAPAAKVNGQVDIVGASWDRRTSSQHEMALTHTFGTITVIVTGSGSLAQLQAFAATLK